MADAVTLVEVGPRDGLQNEPRPIATGDKIRLIDSLTDCGFARIEVASFVNPRLVPQMADGAAVMAGIRRASGVTYAALTPNLKGFEAALAAGADEVAVFASASEAFSKANLNASIAESLTRFQAVTDAARTAGIPVRGYVSCVTDCPFDGPTPPSSVVRVAEALVAMGCREISLGDTLGRATPETIAAVLDAVLPSIPASHLAGHFHDTGGRALDNVRVALDKGIRVFDASVAGLGGCPFAPGAEGNVATEAVLALVHGLGMATGIDPDRLAEAAAFARTLRSRP